MVGLTLEMAMKIICADDENKNSLIFLGRYEVRKRKRIKLIRS
jgi:hypothetical protein